MNPYSTEKLAAHPSVIQSLRATGDGKLITVHLMPQNVCNQSCSFCSYRMPNNKNSEVFDKGKYLPLDTLAGLCQDFAEMRVQGIELTGGGEPLAYPEINELLGLLWSHGFAVGLVTNGTLYHRIDDIGKTLGRCLRWARVSVDAATPSTYSKMRQTPRSLFDKAWATVRDLSNRRHEFNPEFKLGVGFVLCNENMGEVHSFVRMAKDSGADNVRLSLVYSDQGLGFFDDREALMNEVNESEAADQDFTDDSFTVHNLIPSRYQENLHPTQDYRRCPTKDVLCVVEGEGKVYTCCTYTGSTEGLYGNFLEHEGGFRGLWDANAERRRNWDSRKECPVACLYRDRNLAMNKLIDDPQTVVHKEFI